MPAGWHLATGFNQRVVYRWAKDVYFDFFSTLLSLEDVTDKQLHDELESDRGKHPKWTSLFSDENFGSEVRRFVCDKHMSRVVQTSLCRMWCSGLDSYKVEMCKSTVSVWLHDLGFSHQQFSKGVYYFDGHERSDIVANRRACLDTLHSFDKRMWAHHSPSPDPAMRPVFRVYHDESTYYANADQSFHWTDGLKQVLKQKNLGQAIMVSGSVEEVGGMLEHQGEKATLFMEHQTNGYFNNALLISEV